MAASVTAVHSILANKTQPFSKHSFSSAQPLRRSYSLRVFCMADENPDILKTPASSITTPSSATPPPAAPPPPSPPRKPRVSTEFNDVLAFGGPAPERINGRLAMVGFVAAIAVEVANGQGLFSQISDGGVGWFVGTSVVLSLASLVPLFKGVTVQSKSEPVMSSDAEMWNGRMAMLGLVALAFTEYVKGGSLV